MSTNRLGPSRERGLRSPVRSPSPKASGMPVRSTVSSYDGVGRRKPKGHVIFTGPDGVRDQRVAVEEPKQYIGHATSSCEATGDMRYICRPSKVSPDSRLVLYFLYCSVYHFYSLIPRTALPLPPGVPRWGRWAGDCSTQTTPCSRLETKYRYVCLHFWMNGFRAHVELKHTYPIVLVMSL